MSPFPSEFPDLDHETAASRGQARCDVSFLLRGVLWSAIWPKGEAINSARDTHLPSNSIAA